MKQWDETIQSASEGLGWTRLHIWAWVIFGVICYSWKSTKKWLCTHDTTSWIPPETTVRLWGGSKSYDMQVGAKSSDIWLANVTSRVLTDPGNSGSLHIHKKVQNSGWCPVRKNNFSQPPERARKKRSPFLPTLKCSQKSATASFSDITRFPKQSINAFF